MENWKAIKVINNLKIKLTYIYQKYNCNNTGFKFDFLFPRNFFETQLNAVTFINKAHYAVVVTVFIGGLFFFNIQSVICIHNVLRLTSAKSTANTLN